jgi:hypothetical protein
MELIKMERVKGIEPSYSAWKAAALPLSYTRALFSMPIRVAVCNGGIYLGGPMHLSI